MPKNHIHRTYVLSKSLAVKFTTTSQFVSDIRSTTKEMMRVGLTAMDDMMVILILTKLPKEFESFVRVILHNLSDEVTPDFVLLQLEQDSTIVKINDSSLNAPISSGNKNPNHVCSHCKRSGNLSERCWVLHPEFKPSFPQNLKKPSATAAVAETAASLTAAPVVPPSAVPSTALFSGMNLNNPLLLDLSVGISSALVSGSSLTVPTVLDSGCCDVIYKYRTDFVTYTSRVSSVSIGEVGRSVEAAGYGIIAVRGSGGVILFNDALHVPALPYNLVSLSALWRKGAQVV